MTENHADARKLSIASLASEMTILAKKSGFWNADGFQVGDAESVFLVRSHLINKSVLF